MLGPSAAGHPGVELEAGLGEGLQLRHRVRVGGVVEVVVGAVTHYLSRNVVHLKLIDYNPF